MIVQEMVLTYKCDSCGTLFHQHKRVHHPGDSETLKDAVIAAGWLLINNFSFCINCIDSIEVEKEGETGNVMIDIKLYNRDANLQEKIHNAFE
jgi:hypothetical protein